MNRMTLVQALICDNGKAIVLLGDRLVTMSLGDGAIEYETESDSSKIYLFQNNVIGFAGSLIDIIRIKNKIKNESCSINDFIKNLISIINDLIKEDKEQVILQITQNTLEKFITDTQGDSGHIPNEIKNIVYSKLAEFKMDCGALAAGFDENGKPHIYVINDYGVARDCSDLSNFSIGSGDAFSTILFDQECYKVSCSLSEGLYFAYRAKKAAEAHVGVGKNTDIIILRFGKSPYLINAEDENNKLMDDLYNLEKMKMKDCRKKIFLKIEGGLKL